MSKIDIHDLIFDIDQIPERESKDGLNPFWRDIESSNVKTAIIFCLLNEIRNATPSESSNEECRTIVAKCQAYLVMLDLPNVLENFFEKKTADKEDMSPFELEEYETNQQ